jgi:hypothetical protein
MQSETIFFICLFGFSLSGSILYNLFDPNGRFLFKGEEEFPDRPIHDNRYTIVILFSLLFKILIHSVVFIWAFGFIKMHEYAMKGLAHKRMTKDLNFLCETANNYLFSENKADYLGSDFKDEFELTFEEELEEKARQIEAVLKTNYHPLISYDESATELFIRRVKLKIKKTGRPK